MIDLYIVVPCYNEEAVLSKTSTELFNKLKALAKEELISSKSRVVFVDDGSSDKTWDIISSLHNENKLFQGVKLSKNQGHQNALLAGLDYAKDKCDAVISMDADLQDDINAIDNFIKAYNDGNEVVYGVRSSRKKDNKFKRFTAQAYYKILAKIGIDIVYNHADYRLMSNRAVKELLNFSEVNLFLRGLVRLVGFKSTQVYYVRKERFAGNSKYPLSKMISFAFDGITSFSIKPIKMIMTCGIAVFFISIIILIYSLISYFSGHYESGWPSLIISIWALGGLQLFAIGIIGEYIGKVFMETKHRPRYIIDKTLGDDAKED